MNVHDKLYEALQHIGRTAEHLENLPEDVLEDIEDAETRLRGPTLESWCPEDGDWDEAFGVALGDCTWVGIKNTPADTFGIGDVKKALAFCLGANDGDNWIIAGQLHDKRYFYLEAGCDYTVWG